MQLVMWNSAKSWFTPVLWRNFKTLHRNSSFSCGTLLRILLWMLFI